MLLYENDDSDDVLYVIVMTVENEVNDEPRRLCE